MVRGSNEQREYLGDFIPTANRPPPAPPVNTIPQEYLALDGRDPEAEAPYKAYLRSRGVGERLWRLYRIGYTKGGLLRRRLIIPSFDKDGAPNFWSARAIDKTEHQFRYVLPNGSKDVVSNEHLVDWTKPIFLVEGIFDEMAIGGQAISLYGKALLPKLAVALVERKPPMVHVCLDDDAYDEAYYLLARLVRYDLPCSLVELNGKDPAIAGRESVLKSAEMSHRVTGSIGLIEERL